MNRADLIADHARTYLTLRRMLVVIGFFLPPLLWVGFYISTGDPTLQNSMSAYYHAGDGAMRGWFVGLLFAIGSLLIVYHGFTSLEDWALNLAGGFAAGVAIFPGAWPPGTNRNSLSIHVVCAVLFFICIAYVCVFQASATLCLIGDAKKRERYRKVYKALGIMMVLSPVGALLLAAIPSLRTSLIFFIEAAGVWVFASYWAVKTHEIRNTEADQRAARGTLQRPSTRLSDVFREKSVKSVDE